MSIKKFMLVSFQGLYAMSMNCMEAAEGQFNTALTVSQFPHCSSQLIYSVFYVPKDNVNVNSMKSPCCICSETGHIKVTFLASKRLFVVDVLLKILINVPL